MRAVAQASKRGLYRRIPVLAKIIGVDQVDVVAAAKVTGATVIPGMIFFPSTIRPDFVEEAWLAHDMRTAAAARIAGVIPPVIVTDIDPKLAVHRSNNQNRDATPGQKAMATAMAFPDGGIGGRGKTSINPELTSGFTDRYLRMARYVLRNNPIPEGRDYPQRCLDIMAGAESNGVCDGMAECCYWR